MREQSSSGKSRALDPALYARIILTLKDGKRAEAVKAAEEGLGVTTAEAEACIEELWRQYAEQVPPSQVELEQSRFSALQIATILIIAALAGWILWVKVFH